MTEYIHLVGAEEVSKAAANMRVAADDIKRSAMTMEGSVDHLIRQLDELVTRVEVLAEESKALLLKRT